MKSPTELSAQPSPDSATPPNIILLFPDQWRGDWLSHLGHAIPTPFADQLAHEGVSFRRAYSPSPTCTPARAVLATGRTPWNCGRMGYRDHLPWPYRDTLPHRLQANDYQTIQVGKTHFHPMSKHLGFEINRTYEASRREAGYVSHYHAWLAQETQGHIQDCALDRHPNAWPVTPWYEAEYLHNTKWIADESIRSLEHRDTTRPFYLQVGFHRPHVPFDPPKRYWDMVQNLDLGDPVIGDWVGPQAQVRHASAAVGEFNPQQMRAIRRAYAASIMFVDEQIGRLQAAVQRLGLDNNTWILLSSDHGDAMGDHHRLFKSTFLEGSARIPLVVRPPRGAPARRGIIRDELVDLADILPTCCAIAGCAVDNQAGDNQAGVDGCDLGPLIRNETVAWRQQWHGEHLGGSGLFQCCIAGDMKYICDLRNGAEWLFHLSNDPSERHNLINDNQFTEPRAALRSQLAAVLAPRGEHWVRDGQVFIGYEHPSWRPEILGG